MPPSPTLLHFRFSSNKHVSKNHADARCPSSLLTQQQETCVKEPANTPDPSSLLVQQQPTCVKEPYRCTRSCHTSGSAAKNMCQNHACAPDPSSPLCQGTTQRAPDPHFWFSNNKHASKSHADAPDASSHLARQTTNMCQGTMQMRPILPLLCDSETTNMRRRTMHMHQWFSNKKRVSKDHADAGATELGPGRLRPAFVTELGPTELGPPDLGPTDLGPVLKNRLRPGPT